MKEKLLSTVNRIFLILVTLLAVLLLVSCDRECEHEWGEWETVTAATCGSDGVKQRVCAVCEESESQQIPATGDHTFGKWETVTAATCGSDGVKQSVCVVCEKGGTQKIPATGAHTFGNWETITLPTPDTEGTKKRTCQCGASESEQIPMLVATEGLAYALVNGGTAYEVYGIGAATDTDIILPTTYEGKPVIGIGDDAFYGCDNLTSIRISERITRIGNYAFGNCSGLTEIMIPNGVTAIGASAFVRCDRLETVMFAQGIQLAKISPFAFFECSSLASITIPNSVSTIGDSAFEDCSSLASITIPAGVTKIEAYAFYNCRGLTAVHITDLTAWCNISFGSDYANPCYYAHDLYLNGDLITDLVIPESVTVLGNCVFEDCSSLTSITIPATVTSISSTAFSGCNALTSIVVENANAVYHSEGNCLIETATNTLVFGCKNSVIPEYVTSIATYAFDSCSSLTSIIIPANVTSIGDWAFKACHGLTSVIFENTSGWQCVSSSYFDEPSTTTNISSSALENALTAAEYLTRTYRNCDWKRN